jgi:phosphate transport system permease protein
MTNRIAAAPEDEELPPMVVAPRPERGGGGRVGDRVFAAIAAGSGGLIVVLVALVAVFLATRAIPSIAKDHQSFLFSRGFAVAIEPLRFGILELLWTTVISSVIAMVLAVPVAIGVALFITHYAPARLRRPVGYVVDLLAAIPSIVYGIWGIFVLAPKLEPVQRALYHLGFIPLFHDENVARGTIFDAAVVLAIMILPIITAISRDVFERTPREHIEGALALGATRWEMIRTAVLPYGRRGVISGSMLGLGRALGETMAVLLILVKPANSSDFTFSIFAGGQTFASIIGANMKEANGPLTTGAYIAAGLVLFVLTFLVNAAARAAAK